jgi:hypothetical protein
MISKDFLWRDPYRSSRERSGLLRSHPLILVSSIFIIGSVGYLSAMGSSGPPPKAPVPQVAYGLPGDDIPTKPVAPSASAVAKPPTPPTRPADWHAVAVALPTKAADAANKTREPSDIGTPKAVPTPPPETADMTDDPDETGATEDPTANVAAATPAQVQIPPARPTSEQAVPALSAAEQAVANDVVAKADPVVAKAQPEAAPAQPRDEMSGGGSVERTATEQAAPRSPAKPKVVKRKRPAASDVPPDVLAAVKRLNRERVVRRYADGGDAGFYDMRAPVPMYGYRRFDEGDVSAW